MRLSILRGGNCAEIQFGFLKYFSSWQLGENLRRSSLSNMSGMQQWNMKYALVGKHCIKLGIFIGLSRKLHLISDMFQTKPTFSEISHSTWEICATCYHNSGVTSSRFDFFFFPFRELLCSLPSSSRVLLPTSTMYYYKAKHCKLLKKSSALPLPIHCQKSSEVTDTNTANQKYWSYYVDTFALLQCL